eukprot:3516248-Prorocentrum_lima.AAC.1
MADATGAASASSAGAPARAVGLVEALGANDPPSGRRKLWSNLILLFRPYTVYPDLLFLRLQSRQR